MLVSLLIQAGADVNAAPAENHGMTALQGACHGGHLDIVRELYGNNADIRASQSIIEGRSALHAAAEGGHVATVAFLLDNGAFANELPAYIDGVIALQVAKARGFQVITALLTECRCKGKFCSGLRSRDRRPRRLGIEVPTRMVKASRSICSR